MQVTLHATLRQIAGARTVAIPGGREMTVWDLVHELVGRYPALGPQLLDERGNLWRHVHVMVNGRDAPYLEQGLDTTLQPDDVLDVFPPVAGGR